MENNGIDSIEYWESYKNGLQWHLHNKRKLKYFTKEIGNQKNPIGEIDLNISFDEEKALRDEIDRVNLYINLLRSIKKSKP